MKERLKKLADYGGLAFIVYFMASAIFVVMASRNVLEGIQLVPGLYYSHAYPIVIWGAVYLAAYRKFRWKSIFVFFMANALSGEIFNWGSFVVHGFSFYAAPATDAYWLRMVVDFVTLGVSLVVLRPRFLSRSWRFWVPGLVLLFNYALVISWGYPATIASTGNYNNLALNLTDLIGLVAWPVWLFGSMKA